MNEKGYRIRRYEKRKNKEKRITIIIGGLCITLAIGALISLNYKKGMISAKEDNESVKVEQNEFSQNELNKLDECEIDNGQSHKNGTSNIDKSKIILVNRENELAPDYEPTTLVEANVKKNKEILLDKETSEMLENLFNEASKEGITLILVSGYRSYSYQQNLYNKSIDKNGLEHTNNYVAKPGQSEHQTGLAADVIIDGYGDLTEKFGDTEAGKWLAENAHKFGFIIRYKQGKEGITGFKYEPWHIRYLGKDVAKEIEKNNLTLEEYLKN